MYLVIIMLKNIKIGIYKIQNQLNNKPYKGFLWSREEE
nr:MAG TPA: hypothetical protein [Caudoviricetes sp.]